MGRPVPKLLHILIEEEERLAGWGIRSRPALNQRCLGGKTIMNKVWLGAFTLVVLILSLLFYSLSSDEDAEPMLKVSSATVLLNVKNFGAKGDGRTNDTAALQQVFSKAAGGGRTVYFPKGTYMVDSTKDLLVPAGTSVTGDGSGSVIKAMASTFGWELLRTSGSDISLTRLSLDGNNQVNRVLVVGGGSERVTLSGLTVANASQNTNPAQEGYGEVVCGIVIYGNTRDITVSGVEVKNIIALNARSGNPVARGIYVTTAWDSSEAVAKRVTIQGSYIHHVGPADDGDGIYVEDPGMDRDQGEPSGSFITGNQMDHVAKRGIKVYAEGITIQGNHITNSYLNNNRYQGGTSKGQLAPDMFSAISLYGSSNKAAGNIIDGIGSYYAAIEVGAGKTVRDIEITGNQITMGPSSTIKGTTSIRLGNLSGFNVSSNNLTHGERGIWTWQNAADGVINSNVIVMKQGGGIDLSTYLPGYVQQNIQVTNNRITATQFQIRQGSANRNVVIR
jgi:hypothetical protein